MKTDDATADRPTWWYQDCICPHHACHFINGHECLACQVGALEEALTAAGGSLEQACARLDRATAQLAIAIAALHCYVDIFGQPTRAADALRLITAAGQETP